MICVINTGGTISSVSDGSALRPSSNNPIGALLGGLADASQTPIAVEPLRRRSGLAFDVTDSSQLGPEEWLDLSAQIQSYPAEVQGVIVLHGTDTMAYTASALAFSLPRTSRRVLLTGSQIPASCEGSDASANLALALKLASTPLGSDGGVPHIVFGGRSIAGVRASKRSTKAFDAFQARPGRSVQEIPGRHESPQNPRATAFRGPIISLNVQPGFSTEQLETLSLVPSTGALLLNLYGIGSAPDAASLVTACKRLTERGWICMARSMCGHGSIDWERYAVTRAFLNSTIIDGREVTHEAATVKLMAALGSGYDRYWLEANIAGEFGNTQVRQTA